MGQIMLNGNAYGGINGPSVGDRIVVVPSFESGAKLADIIINNETTSIYMPSGGTINDIQVNNVSVVDQYGIGRIDLSPYQLILVPGQYLSINNNTISTTFGIFQGATTSSSGTYGLVPTPSITDKELFLKGDGTWSEIPSTGRTVIANPETIPTDDLTKILIDNITYSVAGGGGGTSDLDAVELTQAEYDALTPEQKADEDKIYFIKDGGSSGGGGGGSDTKVTQIPTTSSDSNEYPLLLKHSANGAEETDTAKTTRDSRLTYNPNTNSINASSYNNEALVRKATYGSIGLRTRGKDSYGRAVNAEYLQEGFKVSRDSTHTGADLTDAGVSSEIETGGLDNYKPLIHVYNTTYDDDSLDSSWRKGIDISHEDMVINKDKADSDYDIGYSEMTSLQITSEDITLSHSEYSQDSVTPTVNKSLQVGVDDITNSSTWDGSHTSLIAAIANAGGGGGGGASVSLLTKAQYNALTPAQKTNGTIYFVYATADSNYEYRVCKDGQIIAQRNKTTGDVTWWFIGYSNGGNDWAFPQDMQNRDWMPASNLIFGVSYDSDKVTQNANIGVYNGYAREWSIDLASLVGYTTWGVVTNSGGTGQNNPWSELPDTNTENAIYFMSKKFSSYDISS